MYPEAGKIFWSRKNINCWYIVGKIILCAQIILNLWWIEMITELEQKNGAIKRKHEIKHGVEAAVQHQSRCMNNIFQRTIYYLCMHRFDDDVMKPVELSHYSNFRCMRAASEVGQWWKVSQVSISSLLHIAPCAGAWTARSEMIYWLSWQCWHPLHTTWRHAFNPPASHNLINGGQSSTAIRKVCSCSNIPDRCMLEDLFSFFMCCAFVKQLSPVVRLALFEDVFYL